MKSNDVNQKTRIYIDGANLHQSAKQLGYTIDYKKFRVWLSQKYQTREVFLFLGLIPTKASLYTNLQLAGFTLVFKETIFTGESVKGNCDAELVLRSVSDFYLKNFVSCILVTGDGDFGCLVDFLQSENIAITVIAPNTKRCSFLLRSKAKKLVYLNDHYHKFCSEKEKAPNADASA